MDAAARGQIYKKVFTYLNRKASIPFTYATPFSNIAVNTAHSPGVDTPCPARFRERVQARH